MVRVFIPPTLSTPSDSLNSGVLKQQTQEGTDQKNPATISSGPLALVMLKANDIRIYNIMSINRFMIDIWVFPKIEVFPNHPL